MQYTNLIDDFDIAGYEFDGEYCYGHGNARDRGLNRYGQNGDRDGEGMVQNGEGFVIGARDDDDHLRRSGGLGRGRGTGGRGDGRGLQGYSGDGEDDGGGLGGDGGLGRNQGGKVSFNPK